MNMNRKRHNQVTMDLQDYKQPWIDWCKSNGLNPSDAFRQIVARLIKQGVATNVVPGQAVVGEPEKPTIRKEVALTPSEFALVEAIAIVEGFSVTKWIVALIRARLTGSPQLGQNELELMARSNLQLMSIGRNLNQMAKALNTTPNEHSGFRVSLINDLVAAIKAHTKMVSGVMAANSERWKIK